MKIKDEITEKDIKKRLGELTNEQDSHLRACVMALLCIVRYKKLVTREELKLIVKAMKEQMVKKWMEKPEELDKLKIWMWFEDFMKPKEKQK